MKKIESYSIQKAPLWTQVLAHKGHSGAFCKVFTFLHFYAYFVYIPQDATVLSEWIPTLNLFREGACRIYCFFCIYARKKCRLQQELHFFVYCASHAYCPVDVQCCLFTLPQARYSLFINHYSLTSSPQAKSSSIIYKFQIYNLQSTIRRSRQISTRTSPAPFPPAQAPDRFQIGF